VSREALSAQIIQAIPFGYTVLQMAVIISMLRGVNVGAHNRIKMDALRAICESLGLQDVQTYVQSGNVVFRTKEKNLAKLARRMESAIEQKAGFRPDIILRTTSEMRAAVARNPFAKRHDIEPSKLLVSFLAEEPEAAAAKKLKDIKADPEELYLNGRELYIYYPNGMARPNVAWMSVIKSLKITGTGRNWNSVLKLLEMAEKLEICG
jgi:uncharacterized protein (DUF1697 family)